MDDGAELRNFTVIYLKAPLEVAEDHVTFMFGIFVLFSFATGCIVLASKLPAGRHYSSNGLLILAFKGTNYFKKDSATISVISTESQNVHSSYKSLGSSAPLLSRPPSYDDGDNDDIEMQYPVQHKFRSLLNPVLNGAKKEQSRPGLVQPKEISNV